MRSAKISAGVSPYGAATDRPPRAAMAQTLRRCNGRQTRSSRGCIRRIRNARSLVTLKDANASAAQMLQTSCHPSDAVTPSIRLGAIARRLDTMLQAVTQVRIALDNFYATLSDEQKAQFEAIGPQRSASIDQAGSVPRRGRRL